MILGYDFGKRRKTPCGDCYEDGHCSMNCGPAEPPEAGDFICPATGNACTQDHCDEYGCRRNA